ncbi:MAG: hypothetical protein IKY78_04360 [Clostridia bacterium]|nr:hypothetical protein [Clostridia bacterium]
MSTSCRGCSPGCTVIAVAASLILGVIAAFLTITEAINVTPAFLWVLLGIAVVYLAVSLVSAALFRNGCCESLCSIVNALLAGALGTILLSVVLLGVEFAAASVLGAVLVGALIFFFFLTVTATACLVRCFFNCNS